MRTSLTRIRYALSLVRWPMLAQYCVLLISTFFEIHALTILIFITLPLGIIADAYKGVVDPDDAIGFLFGTIVIFVIFLVAGCVGAVYLNHSQDFVDRFYIVSAYTFLVWLFRRTADHSFLYHSGLLFNGVYYVLFRRRLLTNPQADQLGHIFATAVSNLFRNDRELVAHAMERHSIDLGSASNQIKNDPEFVQRAIQRHTNNFAHASDEIKSSPSFLVKLFSVLPWGQDRLICLNFVARDVLADHRVLAVLTEPTFWENIKLIGESDLDNRLTAIFQQPVFANRDLVLSIINTAPTLYRCLPDHLRSDHGIASSAFGHDSEFNFDHMPTHLLHNRDIASQAVCAHPYALKLVPPKYQHDKQFILDFLNNDYWPTQNIPDLRVALKVASANPQLGQIKTRDDAQDSEIIALVRRTSILRQLMKFRNDAEIVLLSLRWFGLYEFQYVTHDMQRQLFAEHKPALLEAITRGVGIDAYEFLADALLEDKELVLNLISATTIDVSVEGEIADDEVAAMPYFPSFSYYWIDSDDHWRDTEKQSVTIEFGSLNALDGFIENAPAQWFDDAEFYACVLDRLATYFSDNWLRMPNEEPVYFLGAHVVDIGEPVGFSMESYPVDTSSLDDPDLVTFDDIFTNHGYHELILPKSFESAFEKNNTSNKGPPQAAV